MKSIGYSKDLKKNNFIKKLDVLNSELIFNSVIHSLERLNELIKTLNDNNLEWKRPITLVTINKIIKIIDKIFDKITNLKILQERTITDLISQKNNLIKSIEKELKIK